MDRARNHYRARISRPAAAVEPRSLRPRAPPSRHADSARSEALGPLRTSLLLPEPAVNRALGGLRMWNTAVPVLRPEPAAVPRPGVCPGRANELARDRRRSRLLGPPRATTPLVRRAQWRLRVAAAPGAGRGLFADPAVLGRLAAGLARADHAPHSQSTVPLERNMIPTAAARPQLACIASATGSVRGSVGA